MVHTLMGTQGVCIQVGLRDVAEYHYLSRDDWNIVTVDDPLKRIPDDLGVDSWRYVGVDSCGSSIDHMLQRYGTAPNVDWVLGFMQPGAARLVQAQSHMMAHCEAGWAPYMTQSLSFNRLLYGLQLTRVDVLALDIEGGEYSLFSDYDWSIKPQFMAIECHHPVERVTPYVRVLEGVGYDMVLRRSGNPDPNTGEHRVSEVHFRRR